MKSMILGLIPIVVTLISQGATAGVIELADVIELNRDQILLGDLATFKEIDGELLLGLQGLRIGSSPLPGRKRGIDLRYIQGRIATLDMQGKTLEVLGPEKVEVIRSFQRLDPEQVAEVAKDFILSELENKDGEFKVELTHLPKELILPSGEVELKVIEGRSSHLIGLVYVETRILIDGEDYGRTRVGLNIQRFQKVVTAAKMLNRHQLITREDLKEEMVETTDLLRHQPLAQMDSAIGKRAKRPIREGTVLLAQMVEAPPLIRRGGIITIKGEIGNVHATTLGKALQDGHDGQRIRVRNLFSKETIEGMVHGSNIVLITNK